MLAWNRTPVSVVITSLPPLRSNRPSFVTLPLTVPRTGLNSPSEMVPLI
jgi:hypothetical protein